MAFNPFVTFQRNKRFWMAAILMVCMVSFVFCTGMRGDMSEKIPQWFGLGRSGPAAIEIDGRSISQRDLQDLKTQRNLANAFMKNCADIAFKNMSKRYFEEGKDGKDDEDRKERLKTLLEARSTLGLRKARPRYFDGGVKFDDLVEFKLWQAEADRLGILIEDENLLKLFHREFFGSINTLQLYDAQREAQREFHTASDALVFRAIREEFRVKIAQYAVLGAQPYSYLARRKREGEGGGPFALKFANPPDMPDEMRAPMTLAQVWEFYKAQRAEFNVSLIPVYVDDFAKNKYDWAKKIEDPNEIQKRDFFAEHKNEPYDPSSGKWSLEIPPQIKIEYVMADPTSGPYFDQAKARLLLDVAFVSDPTQSPFTAMATYGAKSQANKFLLLWKQYKAINPNPTSANPTGYQTAGFDQPTSGSAIAARLAGREPGAAASVAFLSPSDGFGALAAYQAWGATKHPGELEHAVDSELLRRRALALYQALLPTPNQFPLDLAFPYLAMNPLASILEMERFGEDKGLPRRKDAKDEDKGKYWHVPLEQVPGHLLFPTYLTVETVQNEMQDMLARRMAEEWAQHNILAVKEALKQAGGDADKFRRELRKHVKEMKLTYGPPDNLKGKYYDRFTINEAAEFQSLKDSYLKYMDQINLFEGRDLTGRKLKPADFYKMFFDATEAFSASAKYQAMPWPPEVKPNNSRDLQFVDPRLKKDITQEELVRFEKHVNENDPNLPAPALYLYKTAERPILFWRTAELPPTRPTDYNKLVNNLKTLENLRTTRAKLAAIEQDINKEKDQQAIDRLKKEETSLKQKEAELKRNETALTKDEPDMKKILERVTDGWKFERARKEEALPTARKIAELLINNFDKAGVIKEQTLKLKKEAIVLEKVSQLHPDEIAGRGIDYSPPSLPKNDQLKYPRDDMMQQVLSLYDLKKPIETGNKDLDEINKDLFKQATDQKRDKDKFVQIIANKPRSIFYVAVITSPPRLEDLRFQLAMYGASYAGIRRETMQIPRDHFLDRAQEQEAKLYRVDFILGLKKAHDFKIVDEDARKAFDDRGD